MKINVRGLLAVFFAAALLPQAAEAWDATGHQVVAAIAWDNMTPTARRNAVALLQSGPVDACLLELFPQDSRPDAEREREFFIAASTWPDVVRPDKDDTRPCTRFHERNWHFINFFWEGVSGGSGKDVPKDRMDIEVPPVNAVERLSLFRPFVACATPACGTTPEERATTLAWILHLVGDLHQPLHTSARVTPSEPKGDQGGNLFKLGTEKDPPSLHGFWDGILSESAPRRQNESSGDYVRRLAETIAVEHPRLSFGHRMRPGEFEAWSREGLATAKGTAYPASLRRTGPPNAAYREETFKTSKTAIALAGYRLADLLNRMFP